MKLNNLSFIILLLTVKYCKRFSPKPFCLKFRNEGNNGPYYVNTMQQRWHVRH